MLATELIEKYEVNEQPEPYVTNQQGRKVEIFTGSWVNVWELNSDGYNRKPTKQLPIKQRIKVDKYFKDLKPINIKDLPFKKEAKVVLYNWNDHNLILGYLDKFYKISNFTKIRGVVSVKIRRTLFKGYLEVIDD